MKTATVHELKDELQHIPPAKVLDLCVRLAKFKKDNKELLTYLLFEAHDVPGYTEQVKQQMDEAFTALNTSQVYLAKKTLRKTLRIANKHIKYMGSKQSEAELLIHFCTLMQSSGLPIKKHKILHNLYQQQLGKIEKALAGLHEDIQYDYRRMMKTLPL
jgi:hypothetical protein